MKLHKLIFTILILFASFQICLGQQESEAKLISSMSEVNCEVLLSQLDSLGIQTIQSPTNIGYVLIYGGEDELDNNFYKLFVEKYIVFRKILKDRLVIIPAKSDKEFKIELWLGSKNHKPQVIRNDFGYNLSTANKKYFFAGESFEIAKFNGNLQLVADCPACCIQTLNFGLLKKFLVHNPNLNAQITVYNKSNRSNFNRFASLISAEIKDFPKNRVKFIYGGKKDGIYVFNKNMASVVVYLISNGGNQ